MLSGELLRTMAQAMAKNERVQRRFRYAVINKLARMEAILGLLHVSQFARDQRPFHYFQDKLIEHAGHWEEYISGASDEAGLAAVKYIYGEGEAADAKPKKRRKWSDCPVCEI